MLFLFQHVNNSLSDTGSRRAQGYICSCYSVRRGSRTVTDCGFYLDLFCLFYIRFFAVHNIVIFLHRTLIVMFVDPWFYNRTSYNRLIDRCIFYSQLYHYSSIVKTSAVVDNWYLFCVLSCTVYKAASVAFTVDVT